MSEHVTRKIEDVRGWNEKMVQQHNIQTYYENSNFAIKFVEGLRLKVIVKALKGLAGKKILEVGCGAGHVLQRIQNNKLYGIDLSTQMIAWAKERLRGKDVALSLSNADDLPFSDNSFEAVLCTEVIEHVVDPDRVVAEMLRVCKSGGTMIITVPNEEMINKVKDCIIALGLRRFLLGGNYDMPERMEEEWHLHVFDVKELIERLSKKIEITRVKAVPFGLFPLRYVIVGKPL